MNKNNLVRFIVIGGIVLFLIVFFVIGLAESENTPRIVCVGNDGIGNTVKVTFYLEADESIKSYNIDYKDQKVKDSLGKILENNIPKDISKYTLSKVMLETFGLVCREY